MTQATPPAAGSGGAAASVVPPPPLELPTSRVSVDVVPVREVDEVVARPVRAAAPATIERRYRTLRRALVVELGLLATIALGLVALELGAIAAEFGIAGIVIVALGMAPLLPLVAFGLWLDRFEPEPPWLLARALLWGAGVSIFVAGIVNTSVAASAGMFAAAVVAAPLGEELLKGLAVWWIYRHRREHLHGIQDAIVYAIFVGVGFTVVEDTSYYAMALIEGTDVFTVFFSRGVMTPLLHSFFTAFTAIGIALAATMTGSIRKALVVLAGYAIAVLLHAVWNGGIDFGTELFRFFYMPAFVIGLAFVRRHRTRQRESLTRWLQLEVTTGLVPQATLDRILARTTLGEFFGSLRTTDHELHARRRMQSVAWSLAAHRDAVEIRVHAGRPPQPIDRAVDDRLREMLATAIGQWQQPTVFSR